MPRNNFRKALVFSGAGYVWLCTHWWVYVWKVLRMCCLFTFTFGTVKVTIERKHAGNMPIWIAQIVQQIQQKKARTHIQLLCNKEELWDHLICFTFATQNNCWWGLGRTRNISLKTGRKRQKLMCCVLCSYIFYLFYYVLWCAYVIRSTCANTRTEIHSHPPTKH